MWRQALSAFNPVANTKSVFIRSSSRIPALDGIRAFSVLYVMMTHALVVYIINGNIDQNFDFVTQSPWYFQWLFMGDKGVDSFFVLSGFLIASLLFKEIDRTQNISLKRFYFRRWLRLTPVYYLFLLLYIPFVHDGIEKSYFFAYAFYVNNFIGEEHRFLPWLWSLAVEEQFYLIFPALLIAAMTRRVSLPHLLLGLIILSLLIRAAVLLLNPELVVSGEVLLFKNGGGDFNYNQLLYINLYTRFGPLMMGALLAWIIRYQGEYLKTWVHRYQSFLKILFLLLGLSIFVPPIYLAADLPREFLFFYHLAHRHIFSAMVILVVLFSLHGRGIAMLLSGFFKWRIWYPFAQLSYAMYLFHLPVLLLTHKLFSGHELLQSLSFSSAALLFLIALVPLMLWCYLLYIFVERPFILLRDIKSSPTALTSR